MWNLILKRLYKDGLLGAGIGLVLGAFVNNFYVLIFCMLFIIWRIAFGFWSEFNLRRLSRQMARKFYELRNPNIETNTFAERCGCKEVVVDRVIEIWAHHSLDTMLPLHKLGIDPRLFIFSQPSPKDFSHCLERCGGLKPFPPPNQRKYGINKLPLGTMDDESMKVEFHETDWNTWMSTRTIVEENIDLRYELSHVDPEKNLLPQSMSLQFLVRFNNGDILTLRRKEGLASSPNSWSCSAEEQLHENDFQCQNVSVAEYLFRRAFIEEVFGHRGTNEQLINRIWTEDCLPIMDTHHIWSFFLEESTGIFQMFGVYQLKINAKGLRKIHELAVSAGWGTTDPEGNWYILYANDLELFLNKNSCLVHRLHGDEEQRIMNSNNLHATSRYRLWRLYIALKRKPETMTSLNLR